MDLENRRSLIVGTGTATNFSVQENIFKCHEIPTNIPTGFIVKVPMYFSWDFKFNQSEAFWLIFADKIHILHIYLRTVLSKLGRILWIYNCARVCSSNSVFAFFGRYLKRCSQINLSDLQASQNLVYIHINIASCRNV